MFKREGRPSRAALSPFLRKRLLLVLWLAGGEEGYSIDELARRENIAELLRTGCAVRGRRLDEAECAGGSSGGRKTEDPRNVCGGELFVFAQRDDWNEGFERKLLGEMSGIAIESDDCKGMLVHEGMYKLGGCRTPTLVTGDGEQLPALSRLVQS